MDRDTIIEVNKRALVRLVAALFAVAGLVPGATALAALPKAVRLKILRVLHPAESALRRLIFLEAQKLSPAPRAKRAGPSGPIPKGTAAQGRVPPFALFDPRKWFAELAHQRRPARGPGPRILGFDEEWTAQQHPPARPAEPSAVALCRRLQALHAALSDIPAQARRLARIQAKRRAAGEALRRTEPLRPGWPPGYRQRQTHPIDGVLSECHRLARMIPAPPDTS